MSIDSGDLGVVESAPLAPPASDVCVTGSVATSSRTLPSFHYHLQFLTLLRTPRLPVIPCY